MLVTVGPRVTPLEASGIHRQKGSEAGYPPALAVLQEAGAALALFRILLGNSTGRGHESHQSLPGAFSDRSTTPELGGPHASSPPPGLPGQSKGCPGEGFPQGNCAVSISASHSVRSRAQQPHHDRGLVRHANTRAAQTFKIRNSRGKGRFHQPFRSF